MQDTSQKSKAEAGILQLVDELDDLIEGHWHPLGRALFVHVDEVFALTNKIRVALPQEVRRAERFVKDSARIVEDADAQAASIVREAYKEAERLTQEAQAKAEQLTSSSEITRAATAKAKQILHDADEHGREIKRGADDYARDVLQNLDDHVSRVMGSIQKGREKIDTRR